MNSSQIHICFIADSNYVVPTAVAIYSIKNSIKGNDNYRIFVIGDSLSKTDVNFLSRLGEKGFDVIVENADYCTSWMRKYSERSYVSTTALLKFTLAERFSELNKILYLDSDIIVQTDLSQLWHYNIDDVYAGVIKNYKPYGIIDYQKEVLKTHHKYYFNSGVMLLNLQRIRANLPTNTFLNIKGNINTIPMDQDVFNIVFQEQVMYLPVKYNLQSKCINEMTMGEISDFYEISNRLDKDTLINNACILHLASPFKPWLYNNVLYSKKWFDLYKDLFNEPLRERRQLDVGEKGDVFKQYNIHLTRQQLGVNDAIVIFVHVSHEHRTRQLIDKLLNQSIKPDIIVLLCTKELAQKLRFIAKENEIEVAICNNNTEIVKKIFEDFRFKGGIKVILYDQILISNNLLFEELIQSYIQYPYAVSASKCCTVGLSKQKKISSPQYWEDAKLENVPSFSLIALANGSILFPPIVSLEKISNIIDKLCESYDIMLVLKVIAMINDLPVVYVKNGAFQNAKFNHKRLERFREILDECNSIMNSDILNTRLFLSIIKYSQIEDQLITGERAKKELTRVLSTTSYLVGEKITRIAKKTLSLFRFS